MAVGETAKLIASLELKDKFTPTVAKVTKSLGGLDSRIDRSSSKATQFGQHLGIGIQNAAKITAIGVGLVATNVALGLNSLVKLESQMAQTEAVIKSTGGVAGVTAEDVRKLSEQFESMNATVGDEVIQNAENLLLTFTNIKKKAFEPTLQAALDMNQALGGGPEGLAGNAKLLGKALQDPEKGLSRLGRAVGGFSEETIKAVKAAVKNNDTLKAQDIILKELEKRYGGSFARAGDTTAGKVAKFSDAIEDLQRTLAAGFLPVVSKVADKLSALFQDKKVIKAVEDFGTSLAGLFSDENLKTGADVLGSLFRTAQEVAPAIAAAASVTGQVVKTAVAAFTSLPKELQTLLVGGLAVNKLTGGLVTNLASGLISNVLKQLVSGVVNVNGGVVNVVGPAGGVPGAAGAAGGGKLGALLSVPIAGAIVAAAVPIGTAFAQALPAELKGEGGKGMSESQTRILAALGTIATNTKPRPSGTPSRVMNSRDKDPDKIGRSIDRTNNAIEKLRGRIGSDLSSLNTATTDAGNKTRTASVEAGVKAKNASMEVKTQVASGTMIQQALLLADMATTRVTASGTQGAIRGVAPPIVGALRNMPRPITNVIVNVSATHVTKSTTIQQRYGPGNGSSGQQARDGNSDIN